MPDSEILHRYHQLWRIEQTFRVSKTDLQTRPVYVRTPAHIEAHFAICFLALLVTRLLERWTSLPAAQLLRRLLRRRCAVDPWQRGHHLRRRPQPNLGHPARTPHLAACPHHRRQNHHLHYTHQPLKTARTP